MLTETTTSLNLKIAVNQSERLEVITLLEIAKLPTTDISDDTVLYLLQNNEKTIGTAGLDIFDDCALLRSVSIIKEEQGKGFGKILNREIENYAKESGINCLYLLTTDAKDFFGKLGFCVIKREESPAVLQQTAEFNSLCPSTATVMKKRI
jgi:amino-acid N-acetyltransferase